MPSRLSAARRIGDPAPVKVIHLKLPTTTAAAAPAPAPAASPGFWAAASTTEKVAIVGAGGLAVLLLYLALKK